MLKRLRAKSDEMYGLIYKGCYSPNCDHIDLQTFDKGSSMPIEDGKILPGILGGIIGDICGSIYEFDNHKTTEPTAIKLFDNTCRFTDDTVMSVATMAAWCDRAFITADGLSFSDDGVLARFPMIFATSFAHRYRQLGNAYPVGYGPMFSEWLSQPNGEPYNSWGNGSAMRAWPLGWLNAIPFETIMIVAEQSAMPTHNHPEGIKGAKAAAAGVYFARTTKSKDEVKRRIEELFGYDLSGSLNAIRPQYAFDVSCQGTMPVALLAFLESDSFEHAVQLAISVGGDSDTIACITGAVAGAYYNDIPDSIVKFACQRLDDRLMNYVSLFSRKSEAKSFLVNK